MRKETRAENSLRHADQLPKRVGGVALVRKPGVECNLRERLP